MTDYTDNNGVRWRIEEHDDGGYTAFAPSPHSESKRRYRQRVEFMTTAGGLYEAVRRIRLFATKNRETWPVAAEVSGGTRFRLRMRGNVALGSLSIPTMCGAVSVQAVGSSKAEALMRAATIAQRISEDPVMQALMPPQAQAAIAASKALATAARAGAPHLKKLWSKIKGPGKKRLAEALAQESVSGPRYQTSYKGVKFTNRGAWQEWQDPEHDNPDANYEDDYGVSGRKRKRKKRKERARREREADAELGPVDEPEAPVDEPQAPVDEQPQQPQETQETGDWGDDGEDY